MKSTKFLTELRARGLQITEKEAKHLQEIGNAVTVDIVELIAKRLKIIQK